MNRARIADLLRPFLAAPLPNQKPVDLSNIQLENISTYINILTRWNDRINLTAIRDPEEIVTRHFGESLFAARYLFPEPGRAETASANDQRRTTNDDRDTVRVADVGSGAGFPGIPLKLWSPAIHLTLIESNQRKSTFLKELARALTLTDINIQTARAESLPRSSFDVVTLRAVERFESVLPIAANLLKPRSRLALLIGARQLEGARRLLPHVSWSHPLPIPHAQSRILLVGNRASINLVTSGT